VVCGTRVADARCPLPGDLGHPHRLHFRDN
jgi:hypothetical protein